MNRLQITLAGGQFNNWLVLHRDRSKPNERKIYYKCKCLLCNTIHSVRSDLIMSGKSTKCINCIGTQQHLSHTKEYHTWYMMIQRCHNPEHRDFHKYGAIGTYVCLGYRESFIKFYTEVGVAPSKKYTIDRIDTYGNYSCGNCSNCQEKGEIFNLRWATIEMQNRNRKNCRYFTYNKETKTVAEWAKELNIPKESLRLRHMKGDSLEAIINDYKFTEKHQDLWNKILKEQQAEKEKNK